MRRRGRPSGVILIVIGLCLLFSNNGYWQNDYLLIVLGIALIGTYIMGGRRLGALVAGSVITAAGIYQLLEGYVLSEGNDGALLLMLGMAFLVVFGVHTVRQEGSSRQRNWPLYPGVVLLLAGAINFAGAGAYWSDWMDQFWPVVIIVCGCLLLFRGNRSLDR